MAFIHIDTQKCNGCGICASLCPPCFSIKDKQVSANSDQDFCILCGHCISACPTNAISHKKLDEKYFNTFSDGKYLETEEIEKLFMKRRSYRNYKKKQVPGKLIERLVDVCRYAPTGTNVQTVEIMVIRDQEKIKLLSEMTVRFYNEIFTKIDNNQEFESFNGRKFSAEEKLAVRNLAKSKRLKKRFQTQNDPIFYNAPAAIIFHSTSNTSTPKDNCVICSYAMSLAAMSLGLGACHIGLFELPANFSDEIMKELNLPVTHKVYSPIILGFPKFKFHKTVFRKPIKITWA
jgi:nitroreductase/NAD-dependent dihydropyrimidine dehydrogenase PreA subunit